MEREDLFNMHPQEIRKLIREEIWKDTTGGGVAMGYVQANLVILPKELAFDFLVFCHRNPKPCPLLEVIEPGKYELETLAKGADIRTDIPQYRVFQNGQCIDEPHNIKKYWRDDLVSFLFGCSLTFEYALLNAGIPLKHLEWGGRTSVYITNIQCKPAGIFHGPTVVTMRAIKTDLVVRAVQVTTRHPAGHGAPVHIGDPSKIGIKDLDQIDFGHRTPIEKDETPVFWACGVTPQIVAQYAKPAFMITHAPSHLFISDIKAESMAIL